MAHRYTFYQTQIVKEKTKLYDVDNVMRSPKSIVEVAQNVLNLHEKTQEHFVALALNTKNVVVGIHNIHVGSLNMSVVHPRDVFQRAILNNAASIILIHNHPSGNPEPSSEDISVTERLVEVSEVIGIPILDHIIVGEWDPDADIKAYVSLRENHYVSFN